MTTPIDSDFRCGFVAVIGRPNVGKSTLINAVLGSKISIVSPKPQTTRHRILGVHTIDGCQIVFVDTPGLHNSAGKAMNRMMNRTATSALMDADVVLFMSEAAIWRSADQDVLQRLQDVNAPTIAVLNKVDQVSPRNRLLAAIAEMSGRHDFAEIVPLSARRRENLDALLGILPGYLPVSPPLFPVDMQTDRSEIFQLGELIREKLTLLLHDELPYGLTVQIERYEADEESDRVVVHAVIWVERDTQKGIVIGKSGTMLKKIGSTARKDMISLLDRPVHLELWVKVKNNWANNEKDLQSLGYETP